MMYGIFVLDGHFAVVFVNKVFFFTLRSGRC